MIQTFAWCMAAIAVVVFVGNHVRFKLWLRHGDMLSRKFDDLILYRERVIDPLVRDPHLTDDEKSHAIRCWFDMLDAHSKCREAWAASQP